MSENGMSTEEGEDACTVEDPGSVPGESTSSERLFSDLPASAFTARLTLAQPADQGFSGDEAEETQPSISAESQERSSLTLGSKHVFIMSDAGKPIYSRHGREEDFVVEMGALQAIMSTVLDQGDVLESFTSHPWKFVFLERSPLLLVAIARTGDSEAQLRLQLSFLYHQILSVLTKSQLRRIFTERRNFDLRRLLGGTERALHRLTDSLALHPSLSLGAVAPLPLPPPLRDGLSSALHAVVSKLPDVVFALVLGAGHLMTMVRMKKYTLSPADLHLILALVSGNAASFRQAESWLPICLPRFDSTGFLHAYITYLGAAESQSPVCLVLLTVDRNAFFALSEARGRLTERLTKIQKPVPILQGLAEAVEPGNINVRLSQVGLGGSVLWHFLYKNRSSGQMCRAAWEAPYVSEGEQRRLVRAYLGLLHNVAPARVPAAADATPPDSPTFRIFFANHSKEALLAWVTGNFELFAALSPVVSKSAAVSRVDKLMKWLKREEERLFILNPLVF